MNLRLGIDVGGTNTDAVVMSGDDLVGWAKVPTTPDVTTGIVQALDRVLESGDRAAVRAVMIGTTHFTNAVVEGRDLEPVAVIRLGAPATLSLPPLIDWPEDLAGTVLGHSEILGGGHEFDGTELSPLDRAGIRAAARRICDAGLELVTISAVFSPIDPSSEKEAAEIVAGECPGVDITLSHEVGRLGLLERENASVLNSALLPLARRVVRGFEDAMDAAGLDAHLYLTQNDGTLMSAAYASRYPVLTFASGPSNSMRGSAYLSGVSDGLVVDIGGTTTDVGALVNGFPRPAALGAEVGGVRTNFRMPDVLSIGLGGGSIVADDPLRAGPKSVGYRIGDDALVFGGEILTATDVAVACERANLGDASRVAGRESICDRAMAEIDRVLEEAIDRMRTRSESIPVVIVGGGAILAGDMVAGASQVLRPQHAAVANAVGAAMAQVSGEVDRVVDLEAATREEALKRCRNEAMLEAELAGSRPESIEIVDVEEIPLAYLPSNASRVRIKAVGDVAI